MDMISIDENNNFSLLNVGNIVWARRYKTEEECERIPQGHREGPFVVIKKNGNKVYVLQCTSCPYPLDKWKILYYPLGQLYYHMAKVTYISCLKVFELQENQFIETIGHLSEYDLNQLNKQLYILIHSRYRTKPKIENKYLNFSIGVGDVIRVYGKRYYIYDVDSEYFYVYPIMIGGKLSICINDVNYMFLFDNPTKVKKANTMNLIDTFHSGEIELINAYKQKMLQFRNETKKSLKLGTVFDYRNNLYYVYDEDETRFFCFRIYPTKNREPKMVPVKVKLGIYYTFFARVGIKKKNMEEKGFELKKCASSEEIKYNERIFQLPKKERREMQKKKIELNLLSKTDRLQPMTVVSNGNSKDEYLIVGREGNVIELVNMNHLEDSYYFEFNESPCPYHYSRIMAKEDYDVYINKMKDLKNISLML